MKKLTLSFLPILIIVFILCASLCANATEESPREGYCYTANAGQQTNIKWTLTGEEKDVTLTFTIDESAKDKQPSTVITAYNEAGVLVGYSNNNMVPWWNGGDIQHIVIGDGITAAYGGVLIKDSLLLDIEIPKSFLRTTGATFESSSRLTKFYVRGTEPEEGVCDISNMQAISAYVFDNAKFTSVKWGTSIKEIPNESFKVNNFRELDLPENIKAIGSKAFEACGRLKSVTIRNPQCQIAASAFNSCNILYTFVGYKGSSAETFAKEGGYKFVDIETGETLIEGTRKIDKDPEEVWIWKREEADDGGNLYQEYKGNRLIDTDWGWFADAKTLVFFDNKPGGYNETGVKSAVSDSGTHWVDYINEIEEIWVQAGIDKISSGAFSGLPKLRVVQIGSGVYQMDGSAFADCTALRSIYRIGKDPVDGVADLTLFGTINGSVLKNTGIETVILKDGITSVNDTGLLGCKNIVTKPTEYMINYARNNYFNLISSSDENEKYEYYRYINAAELIQAGTSAVASFDEETGTLTVFGSGETYDITNYFGGGSKKQPWFSFRNDIKKIIFGPNITCVGKYSFCQLVNLEEIELSGNPIEFLNGSFERCYNLRAIYMSGAEPVIGTFDLRTVKVNPWCFAYNYLVVNAVFGEDVAEIGKTVFEDCKNLNAIYGTPGGVAESFATENGKTFFDVSASYPEGAIAAPPAQNQDEIERSKYDDDESGEDTEVQNPLYDEPNFTPYEIKASAESGNGTLIVVIVAAAAVIIAATVTLIIIRKKKKA